MNLYKEEERKEEITYIEGLLSYYDEMTYIHYNSPICPIGCIICTQENNLMENLQLQELIGTYKEHFKHTDFLDNCTYCRDELYRLMIEAENIQ